MKMTSDARRKALEDRVSRITQDYVEKCFATNKARIDIPHQVLMSHLATDDSATEPSAELGEELMVELAQACRDARKKANRYGADWDADTRAILAHLAPRLMSEEVHRVLRAVDALSKVIAEFDGDMKYCGENLDALWRAHDAYLAKSAPPVERVETTLPEEWWLCSPNPRGFVPVIQQYTTDRAFKDVCISRSWRIVEHRLARTITIEYTK